MTPFLKAGLHLLAAILGMYWGAYLTMWGLYGAPFSLWYAVVFVGGAVLASGIILQWLAKRRWTAWLPLLGSAMLAAYFIPALFLNMQELLAVLTEPTSDRLLAWAAVISTIASLLAALQTVGVSGNRLRNPRTR